MPANTLGRELIELVQIDQDFCNNTYGVAPCTATTGDPSTKCFNTYATCQDQPNYDKGTKQITFKKNQAGDVEEYTIPILKNFSVTLPELNIFSRDTKNQELGKFGKCTVSCSDTIFSDNHLDPYVSERSYNPLERGTFWTKFLARNPYYEGWKIRLYDGEVGQTLAEMNVREYELEKITNPDSNGNVRITATDLMRKTDKDKSIWPPVSDCKLLNDADSNDTSFTTDGRLTDYDMAVVDLSKGIVVGGRAYSIDVETDNGNGTFTYSILGAAGEDIPAGTECESAVSFGNEAAPNVIFGFLQQVFDSSELDSVNIITELQTYLLPDYLNIGSFIPKPTPVSELLGALARQCGFYFWYDDEDQLIKLKVIRDEDDPVVLLDQYNNLIEGKTSSKYISEDRVTDVLIRYDLPIFFSLDQSQVYYQKSTLLIGDAYLSGNTFNESITYSSDANFVHSDSGATATAERFLQMFEDATRTISFELDIKDDIKMAQVFKLAWRGYTDIYGNDEVINWICTGRTRQGSRLKITAQEFKFNVPEA